MWCYGSIQIGRGIAKFSPKNREPGEPDFSALKAAACKRDFSALNAVVQFLSLFLLLFSTIQLSEARIVG